MNRYCAASLGPKHGPALQGALWAEGAAGGSSCAQGLLGGVSVSSTGKRRDLQLKGEVEEFEALVPWVVVCWAHSPAPEVSKPWDAGW